VKKLVNAKGFTLIEVMVGMIILAIGVLGIAGMQVTSVKGNYFSNNLMQASYVAQDRLEFLKNLPYSSASLNGNAGGIVYNEGPVTISGTVFNRSYTVKQLTANSFKEITYTVTWFDGVNHNVSFATIRSI
jgi:type IV pilus assembly protein PilV